MDVGLTLVMLNSDDGSSGDNHCGLSLQVPDKSSLQSSMKKKLYKKQHSPVRLGSTGEAYTAFKIHFFIL